MAGASPAARLTADADGPMRGAVSGGWATAGGVATGFLGDKISWQHGAGGKSGLHGNTVPANGRRAYAFSGSAGGAKPRESATENKPPWQGATPPAARVKRWGKSPPRPWRQGRHGKPHREQGRIGAAGEIPARGWTQGHSRPVARVGREKPVATQAPEEWSHTAFGLGQNPAYRPPDIIFLCPQMPGAGMRRLGSPHWRRAPFGASDRRRSASTIAPVLPRPVVAGRTAHFALAKRARRRLKMDSYPVVKINVQNHPLPVLRHDSS